MEKVNSVLDKSTHKETWELYNQECEKLKSDLACHSSELHFLQELLDRYFEEIVHNENLDEVRESLMRFQDLCYNCGRLKKRLKDHQGHLIDIIKGSTDYDPSMLLQEQSWIVKCKSSLMKDFKTVKKEILNIANTVIQINKDTNDIVFLH